MLLAVSSGGCFDARHIAQIPVDFEWASRTQIENFDGRDAPVVPRSQIDKSDRYGRHSLRAAAFFCLRITVLAHSPDELLPRSRPIGLPRSLGGEALGVDLIPRRRCIAMEGLHRFTRIFDEVLIDEVEFAQELVRYGDDLTAALLGVKDIE
jgi:hypothetical protein